MEELMILLLLDNIVLIQPDLKMSWYVENYVLLFICFDLVNFYNRMRTKMWSNQHVLVSEMMLAQVSAVL